MKLVLLVVSAIAISTVDSQDFPDKPVKGNAPVDQDEDYPTNLLVSAIAIATVDSRDFPDKPVKGNAPVDQDEDYPTNLLDSDSDREYNHINKETGANSIIYTVDKDQELNFESFILPDGTQEPETSKERNGKPKINPRGNGEKWNHKTLMKKILSLEKTLTQSNLQMKIEIEALKKHQYNSANIDKTLKHVTDQLDSLKNTNAKLTHVISQMKIEFQAINNQQGGALIGGQYLTFSTEKVSWLIANARCKSINATLATLANPEAFHKYAINNYHGEGIWLGASDKDREGTWTWINGKSFDKFPWGLGQPDNWLGNEDCLYWGYQNNYNDGTCTYLKRYVCEHGAY